MVLADNETVDFNPFRTSGAALGHHLVVGVTLFSQVVCSADETLFALDCAAARSPINRRPAPNEEDVVILGPIEGIAVPQVWSLTQLYSVDFSQSRIGVNKCVFFKRTIKVCISCC